MDTQITLPHNKKVIESPRVFCIGRNYAAHAAEMNSPMPSQPMVFLKPSTALVRNNGVVILPKQSREVHHEVELVAIIGKQGRYIREENALDFVSGYAVGLDMTARDIQAQAKKKGHPWSVAKGFDTFAPLGDIIAAEEIANPHSLDIRLTVNEQVRQDGTTAHMHFKLNQLIAYCSTIFTLMPGDLLYTGTPEGVGPVEEGDVMVATISRMPSLTVSVTRD